MFHYILFLHLYVEYFCVDQKDIFCSNGKSLFYYYYTNNMMKIQTTYPILFIFFDCTKILIEFFFDSMKMSESKIITIINIDMIFVMIMFVFTFS